MPSFLPPEILDLIVDHLQDERTALKACCLVSKSWVPRARDPPNSPAHYTRHLVIFGLPAVAAAGTDMHAWINFFRHVVTLEVGTAGCGDGRVPLIQFRGLSPTLRSLSLCCTAVPPPEIFNIICSFPLFEDLTLDHEDRQSVVDGWDIPSTSPKLIGSLELYGENCSFIRGLLGLPDGLRFSKIKMTRPTEDAKSAMDLVSKCSDTLEFLYFGYFPLSTFPSTSAVDQHFISARYPGSDSPGVLTLDLSNAARPKDLMFLDGAAGIQWVIVTLQTARLENLRQITIYSHELYADPTEERVREWHNLDRLLLELWSSHSILPRIRGSDSLQTFCTKPISRTYEHGDPARIRK